MSGCFLRRCYGESKSHLGREKGQYERERKTGRGLGESAICWIRGFKWVFYGLDDAVHLGAQ